MENQIRDESVNQQPCRRLEFLNDDNSPLINEENAVQGLVPKVGMEFDTEQDVYDFYNRYAKDVGFSIRRSNGHKDDDGNWLDRTFCCSCQGSRRSDKRDGNVKRHQPETRFGCLAALHVNRRYIGRFQVTKFVVEHTHALASPHRRIFLRSQRAINSAQAAELEIAEISGIAPSKSVGFMARKVGGLDNLGFIPEDYNNYLRSKRTEEMRVGDTGGVLEYLQGMQSKDPSFSYAIQVDIDDLITNIFWADGRMKLDYEYFGDVVCFDTTYRKNKEGRPFALFVGVNHHKQSIVFGAALLYDETCETFMWLFDTFMKVMSGKKPITILTDQDAAMAKALATQWPETHHRLCVWHMYQNAAKHLSAIFDRFKSFVTDFSTCVYGYDEEEDFLNAWNEMLEKYDLQDNSWLQKQFELKEKWALVYGRQVFCADMSTTQRSESMNNQVKNYIGYNHDLLRFFHHFQRLVDDRRYMELKTAYSIPFLPHDVEILKHAASVYTPAIYGKFSDEVWKTWNCDLHSIGAFGTVTNYKVVPPGKSRHHMVVFDSSDSTISCSCKMFEFVGILCAHTLKVFSLHNIKRVPDRYIMKRWTKDAKIGVLSDLTVSSASSDHSTGVGARYKLLLRLYSHLASRAAVSQETFDIAMDESEKILKKVEASLRDLALNDGSCEKEKNNGKESNAPKGDMNRVIKGINSKEKKKHNNSSRRPKGALEKAAKRRRRKKVDGAQSQQSREMDPITYMASKSSMDPTHRSSMTTLLPVQVSHCELPQSLNHSYEHASHMTSINPIFPSMMSLLQNQFPNCQFPQDNLFSVQEENSGCSGRLSPKK